MITLLSVPGTGGAPIFESFPAMPGMDAPNIVDPMLIAQGQCWGRPMGPNWNWFFCSYPAAVFPMGPSWRQGIENVVAVCLNPNQYGIPCWMDLSTGKWVFRMVLDGYSQGAIVVARVWRDEILNPNGRLHHLLPYFLGVITYGPPLRSPGIAYGNTVFCGTNPPPPVEGFITGGIGGPDCLTPAQCLFPAGHPLAGKPAVFDHAAIGDLYGDCPIGPNPWSPTWKTDCPIGYDENLAYSIIQDFNGTNITNMATTAITDLGVVVKSGVNVIELVEVGIDAIEAAAGAQLTIPASGVSSIGDVVGLVVALVNGGMFLIQGTAPHGNYDAGPATEWLIDLGKQYADL